MNIRTRLIVSFFIISLVVGLSGLFSINKIDVVTKTLNEDIPESIDGIHHVSDLDGFARLIQYYDEVLTQSARNYAFTGDAAWKERYEETVPKLDDTIKKAIEKGDETEKEFFSSVDEANIILVNMEEKAINLVDQNFDEEAVNTLESEEYWEQKDIYKKSLSKYLDKRNVDYDVTFEASTDSIKNLTEDAQSFIEQYKKSHFAFIIFSIIIAMGFSFVISLLISIPLDKINKTAQEIRKGNLNVRLDPILKKRKNEISELASSIEEMAKELKQRKKEQEKTQNELKKNVKALKKSERAAYELVEDLNASLEKLKEMDIMKSQFLSVTSHELKTPITPIRGQLQLIIDEVFGKVSKKQQGSLEVIKRNVLHLQALIDDILDISKLQANKMKFIYEKVADPSSIINESVENMQEMAKKRNVFLKSSVAKLPSMVLDKNRIGQVFNNLISNAVKFSKEKGTVTVEVKKGKGKVLASVQDEGIGISKEDGKKLFKPFSQIDSSQRRRHEGTGLGLSICKGIIKEHSGKIWFESKGEGKGTKFFVEIPIKHKKPKQHE